MNKGPTSPRFFLSKNKKCCWRWDGGMTFVDLYIFNGFERNKSFLELKDFDSNEEITYEQAKKLSEKFVK